MSTWTSTRLLVELLGAGKASEAAFDEVWRDSTAPSIEQA